MARRDLSLRDASSSAASELDYVIRSKKWGPEKKERTVSAEQAMRGERVVKAADNRDITRVLFISRNPELLNPTKQSLDGYVDLADLFEEVHILILRQGIPPRFPTLRVNDNVWIYTAAANWWWQTPQAGFNLAEEQLSFASGFRPDIIVALDPFESALVAYLLGKKYHRPTQLHISEDFTADDFNQRGKHNSWRLIMTRFTIKLFSSVRTLSYGMQRYLARKFDIPDLAMLPRYQNYQALITSEARVDLKHKYRPFLFVMLFVGKLGYESTLYRALDAARFVLNNPHVGLVVLGDGPSRKEFQQRAKLLAIEPQVVFETKVADIEPYLKSANLLLVTDTDAESEELVLKSAAAGIPMVMSRTEKRCDIFTDGESAFICDTNDTQAFTDSINELLNDIALRKQFATESQDMITRKFHNNLKQYQEAYRLSIEQAFFVEGEEEATEE